MRRRDLLMAAVALPVVGLGVAKAKSWEDGLSVGQFATFYPDTVGCCSHYEPPPGPLPAWLEFMEGRRRECQAFLPDDYATGGGISAVPYGHYDPVANRIDKLAVPQWQVWIEWRSGGSNCDIDNLTYALQCQEADIEATMVKVADEFERRCRECFGWRLERRVTAASGIWDGNGEHIIYH